MKIKKYIFWLLLSFILCLNGYPVLGSAPGDVQYERQGGDPEKMVLYPPSIFQHWVHRIRYRCDACHDSLFEMKLSTTPVTHDLMKAGKVCSVCHNGQVAFDAGFENCNRCHVSEEK